VRQQTAEAVADITSTGETLAANHLRILEDGVIHRSQATLFAARAADWTPEARRTLAALAQRLALPLPDAIAHW
jgi:ATP phosphoribosyltransferase